MMETREHSASKSESVRRPCQVIVEGDPDCKHVFHYHGMSSQDGIVFADLECGKCGRAISYPAEGTA